MILQDQNLEGCGCSVSVYISKGRFGRKHIKTGVQNLSECRPCERYSRSRRGHA